MPHVFERRAGAKGKARSGAWGAWWGVAVPHCLSVCPLPSSLVDALARSVDSIGVALQLAGETVGLDMLCRGDIAVDLKAHQSAGGCHIKQGGDARESLECLPELAAEVLNAVPALWG